MVWASCHVSLVRDGHGHGEYYFMQIQDITARKKLEHELAHQAVHDSLTGLPNRTLLTDRLVHGLAGSRRRGAQLGVIFLDIDHLKDVNDSLGHAAGDKLLRHTARRVASALRPGDTVARLGGDEFVVVCDDVSTLETEEIAGRVMAALSEPYLDGDQEMKVAASIGIAIADGTRPRKACSVTPMRRCTGPRSAAGDGSSCSTKRCGSKPNGASRPARPCIAR